MGSGHRYGLQLGSLINPSSRPQACKNPRQWEKTSHGRTGGCSTQQRSHHPSPKSRRRVCQSSVFGPIVRQLLETGQITKQICDSQDSQGVDSTRGLDDQARSQRRLPGGTHPPTTSEIPSVHMEVPNMAIQRLAIQSQQCTTCIHKTTETSSSNLVPRRYDSSGKEQGGREETSSYSPRVAGSLGVQCQYREEHYQPSSKAEIPGVLFELPDDDHLPSRRQDAVDKESSEKVEKLRPDVCESAGTPIGHDGHSAPSNSPSSPPLQESGEGEVNSSQPGASLRPDAFYQQNGWNPLSTPFQFRVEIWNWCLETG